MNRSFEQEKRNENVQFLIYANIWPIKEKEMAK